MTSRSPNFSLPELQQLNRWCASHTINIRFLSIARQPPALRSLGQLALTATTIARGQRLSQSLREDEWQALIELPADANFNQLNYRCVRYSQMLALREQGEKPAVLAATALLCSTDQQQLLWQKRSASSHLFGGFLSLFGGGFNPVVSDGRGDNNDSRATAIRECREESGLNVNLPEQCLVTLTQETDTGAVQINFLGVAADFSSAVANPNEGELEVHALPALDEIANLQGFTHLALANLYCWRCTEIEQKLQR